MSSSSPTPSPGPVAAAERSLTPDLARGVMLLVIATVHAHILWALAHGAAKTAELSDTIAEVGILVFGEGRGYPMFAALFGYGVAQIHLRWQAKGGEWPAVRSLLRRRGRWLFAFGVAHTLLLFFGDILAVYGLIALLFTGFLVRGDRRLLTVAAVWGVAGSAVYAVLNQLVSGVEGQTQVMDHPLTDVLTRAATWPVMTPMLVITSVFPFLIGVRAGRRQLLTRPERHLVLLQRVAAVGIPVAVLGGAPYALASAGVWDMTAPPALMAAGWLHILTGYAGGFGYAALIALVAVRIGARRGPVVTALAACGQRSMSCYLLQSVAWTVLFAPYALDLAVRVDGATAIGIGVGVWLAVVVLADVLRRAGVRGPAETALRRLTYGPRSAPAPAAAPVR